MEKRTPKIGVSITPTGVEYEMEGTVSMITSMMTALLAKYAREMSKVDGAEEMWIDSVAQGAKEVNWGDIE